MKKRYVLFLCLFIALISMSCVNAGLFDWFGGHDITFINESTGGMHEIYGDGSEYTSYWIIGIFKDLPDDSNRYSLKTAIYDENGKLIEAIKYDNLMEDILQLSKMSESCQAGLICIEGFKNVSIIEVSLYNTNDEKVFEENFTFDMGNIENYHYNESYFYTGLSENINYYSNDDSSSSSSDTSSSSSQSSSNYGSYVGNANTGKFHIASCSSVSKMSEKNKVFFSNRDDAINQGYVPCQRCNP